MIYTPCLVVLFISDIIMINTNIEILASLKCYFKHNPKIHRILEEAGHETISDYNQISD